MNRTREHIAIAVAESPFGPWKKSDAPILSPAKNSVWKGDDDNRYMSEYTTKNFTDTKIYEFNNVRKDPQCEALQQVTQKRD